MIDDSNIGDVYMLRQSVMYADMIVAPKSAKWYYNQRLDFWESDADMLKNFKPLSERGVQACLPDKKANPGVVVFLGVVMIRGCDLFRLLYNGMVCYGERTEVEQYMELAVLEDF